MYGSIRRNIGVPQEIIVVSVLILLVLLTSACQSASKKHAVYVFNHLSSGTLQAIYHPGDHFTLTFSPVHQGDTDDPSPTPITITVRFIGPFPSSQVALQSLASLPPPAWPAV